MTVGDQLKTRIDQMLVDTMMMQLVAQQMKAAVLVELFPLRRTQQRQATPNQLQYIKTSISIRGIAWLVRI